MCERFGLVEVFEGSNIAIRTPHLLPPKTLWGSGNGLNSGEHCFIIRPVSPLSALRGRVGVGYPASEVAMEEKKPNGKYLTDCALERTRAQRKILPTPSDLMSSCVITA